MVLWLCPTNMQAQSTELKDDKSSALEALMTRSQYLLNAVAEVSYLKDDAALTLTTEQNSPYYIWTNAPNTGGGSEGPIANLIDGSTDNFFHTQWDSNGKSTDGLDHYVEVDLGEGNKLSSFCFTYTTRKNVTYDYPQTMIIYGSNDKANYTPIKVISNGMPASGGMSYDSPVIDGGKEYRYLRFMVTKTTYNRVGEGKEHNYWHMAEFDIYPVKTNAAIKDGFASITSSDVIDLFKEKISASLLLENSPTDDMLEDELAVLIEKYNTLKSKYEECVSLPFNLSGDERNPILYNILINRGDGKALKYDGINTDMVDVASRSIGDQAFDWYFMLGDDQKINIYPYLGRGKALGTNSYSEGAGKVKAVAPGTDGYGYSWSVTKIDNNDWYNITIFNGATNYYLSNWGGSGNKMGFFNSNTSSDGGSMFNFKKVEIDYNEVAEIEVLKTTGTGLEDTKWKSLWTSDDKLRGNAALKLSVGANNITTNAEDAYLRLYVGQSGSSTYTLIPAAGYYIESYSFDFVKVDGYDGTTVNLVVDGVTYNPTDEKQSITSNHNASESSVTFGMNGANKGIILSNFKVRLKPLIKSYVTYKYYYNDSFIGEETLEAIVGGNYPTPVNVPRRYKASAPQGLVKSLAVVDVNCDIWSINIGGRLTDVWNTGSWTQLAAGDIPEKITTDVKINGNTAVTEVWSNVVAIDIDEAGYLAVDFNDFKNGNNRLQMVGVDLLNEDGAVVASDYHFGYSGTAEDKYIYSLNVPEAGRYNLRYLVSFQGENNTSNGEIAINLYTMLVDGVTFNGVWNTGIWKALPNESIPQSIKESVKLVNNSGEHAVDKNVSYFETYFYFGAGEVNTNITYSNGNNRLEIVGVDLLDVYGKSIESSNDYHFGYTGTYFLNNDYSLYVQNSGYYKLRILVCFKNENNSSNGVFTVTNRDVYAEFKQVWDSAKEIVDKNESGMVGYYTDVTCGALGNVVEQYKDYSRTTPLADVDAAREALATAANALQINLPSSGKLYKIKSVSTKDYCKDKYVHANRTGVVRKAPGYVDNYYNHLHLLFDASVEPASLAIFTFEENTDVASEYKMKNLHTGMYVKSFQKGAEHLGRESDASYVKVMGFAPGQLTLQIGESSPMHAQENYGVIVGWRAEADNASLWAIEEVDYSAADFDVSIGAVRWSTLCLNYAVEVPEGVTAYAALGVDGNSVVLQSVGDVIPAGTAVLLNLKEGAATGNYSFKYTSQSVEPQSLSENKLVGTYYDSYIEADKENVKYYMLAKIDDTKAGMKQIYREYSYDDNGTLVSHKNTDDGTHFKNNANKVYLPVPKENGANEVKAYSLRIIDGTTGVDEVVGNIGVAPEGIYDLSGRRIIEITEPGIYIVNGKKFIKK